MNPDNWEEFYANMPKPSTFDEDEKKIRDFVTKHVTENRKIALVTVSFVVYKILTLTCLKKIIFYKFFSQEEQPSH